MNRFEQEQPARQKVKKVTVLPPAGPEEMMRSEAERDVAARYRVAGHPTDTKKFRENVEREVQRIREELNINRVPQEASLPIPDSTTVKSN